MPLITVKEKVESQARRGGRRRVWLILPLIILGLLACGKLFSLASNFRASGLVMVVGALACLPTLAVFAFALWQGFRHARTLASTFKWWHILWALIFVSGLVFRNRRASDIASDPLDAWAMFRIAVDTLVAFVLLGRLALRRTHWLGSMLQGVVGALVIFGLVGVASTAWSVFPSWTLYKSWEYLVDIALLAAILETLDSMDEYRDFFNWTWALYGFLLLSVWLGVVLWPQEALHGETLQSGALLGIRLDGVMPSLSSNDVGTFAAILALLSLARLFPASEERFSKSWYAILLVGSLVTMVLAQTRTAFAGFLFGGFFILLFSKRGKLGAFVTFVVAPIVLLATMGGLIWSFLERGQTEEQLASLSSRADWWSFAWQTFLERPLTGFGAYAAGRFAVLARLGLGETSTMHSDFLETLVGTSIWGLIPFVVALAATWWLLWRCVRDSAADPLDRQLAYEGLAILGLLTFRSVFMTMLTWHPPLHFLAILGYVEFLRRRRRAAIQLSRRHVTGHLVAAPDSQLDLVFDAGGAVGSQNTNTAF